MFRLYPPYIPRRKTMLWVLCVNAVKEEAKRGNALYIIYGRPTNKLEIARFASQRVTGYYPANMI